MRSTSRTRLRLAAAVLCAAATLAGPRRDPAALAGAPGRRIQPAQAARTPNDPFYPEQASFGAAGTGQVLVTSRKPARETVTIAPDVVLDLPQAWAITTGSRDVRVAVLDDGFFYRHEDIAPNVWQNPGETGTDDQGRDRRTNGVDDDRNGFADDVVGWDFVFEDPDPDHYVYDGKDRTRIQPYWHSISALGIIGAKGNNGIGIAGINWTVSLMLLKIGAQGVGTGEVDRDRPDRAARALRYAADNGARVVNWSGFVSDTSPDALARLRAAIAYARDRGVLVVVGAGNDFKNLDDDAQCAYPQCFDEPNLLRVAQLARDGALYRYEVQGHQRGSNYGARRVELAATGEHFTTDLWHAISIYETSNGTSSAGPVVAGVAALALSVRPDLTAADLKRVLMESGTPAPSLAGRTASGRAVNALRAVQTALALPR